MIRFALLPKADANAALAVPVLQGESAPLWGKAGAGLPDAALTRAGADGFRGKSGETLFSSGHAAPVKGASPGAERTAKRLLLAGLGKKSAATLHSLRLAGAAALKKADDAGVSSLVFALPGIFPVEDEIQALVEGAGLAAYRFDRHKSGEKRPCRVASVSVVSSASEGAKAALLRAQAAVAAVDFARDLINEPPSHKPPETLGRAAASLAGGRISVKIFHKKDLIRMQAGGLLGVNRGSASPPVMVHLHYKPAVKARRHVALVGKGITFDAGGLSIKTGEGMMTMKYDMAGAASVFGIFKALSILKPAVEVHGIAPITENLLGPDAYKPGDVLRAMNGKTMEILNTDAEGRIVLADALSYAVKLPVDEIVDVATLTGAAAIALGRSIAAVMANDDGVFARLQKASDASGEKIWRLPLEKDYKEHIKSKVADLKNIGNPGEAGTIIGGLFLEEFVAGKPWAHIDMASVGWNGAGSLLSPAGATGAPIRTLLNYVLG